jgi:ABC-type Fe3+/spermidine/putrescine transport system ATPase subunit
VGTELSAVLQLKNVHKAFAGVPALAGVDAMLAEDSYVSLLGPSGSGKTTLLRVIAGFEQPDGGEILFAGRRIDGVPPHERGIGFVFQNFALFPHLSVAENIAFGLENRAVDPVTDAKVVAVRVRDMIGLVGLSGLEDRAVTQISGGQKQRVALARTLVTEPSMVLLDEPLGALDANLRTRMRSELRTIRERCGVTFLHVTGSETEALAMGDTVLVLDRGRIAQSSDAGTLYSRPASADVARFLNCYNIFSGAVSGDVFESAVGGLRHPLRPGCDPPERCGGRWRRGAHRGELRRQRVFRCGDQLLLHARRRSRLRGGDPSQPRRARGFRGKGSLRPRLETGGRACLRLKPPSTRRMRDDDGRHQP